MADHTLDVRQYQQGEDPQRAKQGRCSTTRCTLPALWVGTDHLDRTHYLCSLHLLRWKGPILNREPARFRSLDDVITRFGYTRQTLADYDDG